MFSLSGASGQSQCFYKVNGEKKKASYLREKGGGGREKTVYKKLDIVEQ